MSAATALNGTLSKQERKERWQRLFISLNDETEYEITDIKGTIPPNLNGVFLRDGPGFFELGGQTIHVIDCDGMLVSIRISNGRAYYANKYVRTRGYIDEKAAGKVLYRGVFGTRIAGSNFADSWWKNFFNFNFKNTANTNVIEFAGKGLAMWEGGLPHEVDVYTLETKGITTLGGALHEKDAFSAHPRVDHIKNRLVNYGVDPMHGVVKVWEFDDKWKLFCRHQFPLIRRAANIHSFAITDNYIIIMQNPIAMSLPNLLLSEGLDRAMYSIVDKNVKTILYILKREPDVQNSVKDDASAPTNTKFRVVTTENLFVYHHANAYERDNKIILESVAYDSMPPLDTRNEIWTNPAGRVVRFTIDIESMNAKSPVLDGAKAAQNINVDTFFHVPAEIIYNAASVEMPTFNSGLEGTRHRHLYLVNTSVGPRDPWAGLVKFDTETREYKSWDADDGCYVGEPIFVPDGKDGREDDGWLLCLKFDARTDKSSLMILDARKLEDGPIAELILKNHIPFSFHCSFVDAEGRDGSHVKAQL
ncbi:hypothetical protein HK102_011773 [Quaeritorhiza haematococci]|nr:hypothetical protein HK102_011773 [Quaeritorhiza haematococci]